MRRKLILILAIVLTMASCESQMKLPHKLASFTENDVTVFIYVDENTSGEFLLLAIFTPPTGYHLYSKDIPLTGVDGLGRPTLIELTKESRMKPLGELVESVSAETPNFEPKELLVYPPGAVTLMSLPVQLPSGDGWMEDAIKVTYVACSDGGCKAPVTGKIVEVRIPSADLFE